MEWNDVNDKLPVPEGRIGRRYRSKKQYLLADSKGNIWTDYVYFAYQHPEWESMYRGIGVHYNFTPQFGAGGDVTHWAIPDAPS